MESTLRAPLAAVLRAERSARRMTIVDLALATGQSERTVMRHLNQQRDVEVKQLESYADAFGLDASELLLRAERRRATGDY